ncbi:hypothetical protein BC829DRAFT_401173 [Chytridium lagenaria]|nr:hypothetical protein BC829DRAFT_401173 [Chytridium lagenaria]
MPQLPSPPSSPPPSPLTLQKMEKDSHVVASASTSSLLQPSMTSSSLSSSSSVISAAILSCSKLIASVPSALRSVSLDPNVLHLALPILLAFIAAFSTTLSVLLFVWLSVYLILNILLDASSVDPLPLKTRSVTIAQPNGPFGVTLACYSRDCAMGSTDLPCYSPTCPLRNKSAVPSELRTESSDGTHLLSFKIASSSSNGSLQMSSSAIREGINMRRAAAATSSRSSAAANDIPRPPLRRRMSFMSQGFAKGIFSRHIPTTNVFGVMHLDDLPTLDELKDQLCGRILHEFPRFRSHFNRFWEDHLPVWRCHVLKSTNPKVPSAVILETHHGLGDGLSLVKVALGNTFPPITYVKKHPEMPHGVLNIVKWVGDIAGRFVLAFVEIILNAIWRADSETASSRRKLVKLPVISLAAIKSLKNAYSATVNDIIMAALAGAYRRYLHEVEHDPRFAPTHSSLPSFLFRAVCPFSFPRDMSGHDLHNRFAMITCPVPAYMAGPPSVRVAEVKRAMEEIKANPERPVAQVVLQRIVNAVFGTDTVGRIALSFASRHSLAVTNVPGPQMAAYLCGKKVVAVDPVVSSTTAFWGIFSYDGGVNVSVNFDERMYKDGNRLSEMFMGELERMCEETGVNEKLVHRAL